MESEKSRAGVFSLMWHLRHLADMRHMMETHLIFNIKIVIGRYYQLIAVL